jgi:hypothetical protein
MDDPLYNLNESLNKNITMGKLTEWFDYNSGAKQGDNMSPTICSVFINDFVKEIEDFNIGYEIGEKKKKPTFKNY